MLNQGILVKGALEALEKEPLVVLIQMGVSANVSARLDVIAGCSIGILDLFLAVHVSATFDGTDGGREGENAEELHGCFEKF